MSFCATCGRPRTGAAPYCRGCGAEFSDARDTLVQDAETTGAPGRAVAEPPDAGLTRWDTRWYKPVPDAATSGPPTEADPRAGSGPRAGSAPAQGWYGPGSHGAAPGGAGTSGSPPSPRRSGTGILVAALVVVVLAVGGGAFALVSALTGHKTAAQSSGQPTGTAATRPASSATAATSPPPASSRATASPGGIATPAPATTVRAAPGAAANPAAPAVEALLDRYFTAINDHDYAAYSSLLDAQMQQLNPPSHFASGYATTRDSAETLTSITSTGGGDLAATVSFTSNQSPADSINNSSCTAWTITLYLQPHGSGYLIGAPPASYQPAHQNCP